MKGRDDFEENGVAEDIIHVRYNHYIRRYNDLVKEVLHKKREFAKYRRQNQQHAQINTQNGSSNIETKADGKPNTMISIAPLSMRSLNLRNSSGTLLSPLSDLHSPGTGRNAHFLTQISPAHLDTYKKTVSIVKEAKNSPQKISLDMTSSPTDKAKDDFDLQLSVELDKFNRLKGLKQREAIETYEEEIKRIKIIQSMSVREKKRIEFEKKQKADKKN